MRLVIYSDNKSTTLYAKWSYSTIGELEVPWRWSNAFEFDGWYNQLEGGVKVDKDTVVSDDLTIYPHWNLISSLSLHVSELTLDINDECCLMPWITPDDGVPFELIHWNSSDTSVATVNELGNVKALSAGQAIITATSDNGHYASCNVTVSEKYATNDNIRTTWAEEYIDKLGGNENYYAFAIAYINDDDIPDLLIKIDGADGWINLDHTIYGVHHSSFNTGDFATSYYPRTGIVKELSYLGDGEQPQIRYDSLLDESNEDLYIRRYIFNNDTNYMKKSRYLTKTEFIQYYQDIIGNAQETSLVFHENNSDNWKKYILSEQPPIEVKLSSTHLNMDTGDFCALTSYIETDYRYNAGDFSWTSDDESVATVYAGIVKAIAPGTTTIKCRSHGDKYATCEVSVKNNTTKYTTHWNCRDAEKKYDEVLRDRLGDGYFSIIWLNDDGEPDVLYASGEDISSMVYLITKEGSLEHLCGYPYVNYYYRTGILREQYNTHWSYYNYSTSGSIDNLLYAWIGWDTPNNNGTIKTEYYSYSGDNRTEIDRENFVNILDNSTGNIDEHEIVFHPINEENLNYYLYGQNGSLAP